MYVAARKMMPTPGEDVLVNKGEKEAVDLEKHKKYRSAVRLLLFWWNIWNLILVIQ